MRKIKFTLAYLIVISQFLYSKELTKYDDAFKFINKMLINDIICFKEAVLHSEYAFIDEAINVDEIELKLSLYRNVVELISNAQIIQYDFKDINSVKNHAALYKFFTDSIAFALESNINYIKAPFEYNYHDPFGQKDWSNMFVLKLLETGKGNCHSLPYLYKILAEEMGIPAYLAFAQNHIYIKSYSEKTGWYNTELTSGTFPIDAWIMASGYVTVEAIQNGLYMDTLSTKQSVANCLVDLAQGYQRKFGKDNPEFVVKCCNTCLKYHPTNVNAMLTKAEAQKFYIQAQMKAKNLKKPQDLFVDNSIKEMYEDMEQTYVKLHLLGYRRMPEEMYIQWMGMLKNEPTIYNNKKISTTKKQN